LRRRFGEFVLEQSERQLLRGGQVVHLSPKAFELLSLLVDRAPAAVAKEELLQAVWPGVHVADASLTNVVAEIRAATGDDARRPRFLRTVHAFGYAFCGELVQEGSPVVGGTWHLVIAGRRYALSAGPNVVGRDPAAAIPIDHVSVSRRHAQVSLSGGGATIQDLGSRNGTYLNGRRLETAAALKDGDVIRLGSVTIVVEGWLSAGSTQSQSVS
jgi:DNA-binding winged helix-turn-helix (wHTH) protein